MNVKSKSKLKPSGVLAVDSSDVLDALEVALKAEQNELLEKGMKESALAVQSVRAALVTAQLEVLKKAKGSASNDGTMPRR